MKIPARTTYAYARLKALSDIGPATFDQGVAAHGLHGDSPSHVLIWYERNVDIGNLTVKDGVYSLTPGVRKHFDGCEVEAVVDRPIVQAPVINRFSSAMTGYEAAMRRNVRDDAPLSDGHYINGGSMPEPFRGGVKP